MQAEERKPHPEGENHTDRPHEAHGHSHDDHQHAHGHPHGHTHKPHDWHSPSYVDEWIKRDEGREDERRPRIKQMVEMAKLPRDAAIAALDIGAGYGFVSEEVLRAFPKAHVTLQDFSALMLERARSHLAAAVGRTSFALCDLTAPNWVDQVGGPFDLIVSAIAIHNLRSTAAIAACYRGVAQLLKPGAPFLDYDLFSVVGGIETHIGLMQEAGMSRVSRASDDGHAAIIVAHGRRIVCDHPPDPAKQTRPAVKIASSPRAGHAKPLVGARLVPRVTKRYGAIGSIVRSRSTSLARLCSWPVIGSCSTVARWPGISRVTITI